MKFQDIIQKANTPLIRGIDLKFWFLIICGLATAISLLRAIPGMQAKLEVHGQKLAVIESKLEGMPELIEAKVIAKISRRSPRRTTP